MPTADSLAYATMWGVISASAFLIGSVLGVSFDTSAPTRSKLMAFGGGALIVASAVEVFSPVIAKHGGLATSKQWVIIIFGFVGALVYAGFETLLNHLMHRAEQHEQQGRSQPPPHEQQSFPSGHGQPVALRTSLRFRDLRSSAERATLGLTLGLGQSSSAKEGVRELAVELVGSAHGAGSAARPATVPASSSAPSLQYPLALTPGESRSALVGASHGATAEGKQASFMVWLGCFIDSIPESLVIGILANEGNAGSLAAFVLGVFLANLPEAMSASEKMKLCGVPPRQIVLMWSAIVLWTGVGSFLGALAFPARSGHHADVRAHVEGAIEGLAGGQLLSLVSNTILPEAYAEAGHTGSSVGLCCMLGFLSVMMVTVAVQDVANEEYTPA